MSNIKELIQKQREKTQTHSVDVNIQLGGEIVHLRFKRILGLDWVRIKEKCPPETDVAIDNALGFNHSKAVLEASKVSGVRVIEDVEHEIDEWDALLEVLDGSDFEVISTAIWGLNEYDPTMEKAGLLKKELPPEPEKKQN